MHEKNRVCGNNSKNKYTKKKTSRINSENKQTVKH